MVHGQEFAGEGYNEAMDCYGQKDDMKELKGLKRCRGVEVCVEHAKHVHDDFEVQPQVPYRYISALLRYLPSKLL